MSNMKVPHEFTTRWHKRMLALLLSKDAMVAYSFVYEYKIIKQKIWGRVILIILLYNMYFD